MEQTELVVTATASRAKINLSLEILGRRPDGYHDIRTIFQEIELSDKLTFDWNSPGLELVCHHFALAGAAGENLIMKAARGLERFLGRPIAVKITLDKKIPLGAGLGGGSGNAAAALRVMGEKFGVPEENLREIAAGIGADVPFFLQGGTAAAEGRGEILTPLPPLPAYPVVVVKPSFSISTPFAYGQVRHYSDGKAYAGLRNLIEQKKGAEIFNHLKNDFEEVLFPLYPELKEIKGAFLDAGAMAALLSGSGSAVFAVAGNAECAEELALAVKPFGEAWITKMRRSDEKS